MQRSGTEALRTQLQSMKALKMRGNHKKAHKLTYHSPLPSLFHVVIHVHVSSVKPFDKSFHQKSCVKIISFAHNEYSWKL